MSEVKRMRRDRYWIRFHVGECPVCGRDASYRERVYDEPKPDDDRKRYVQIPNTLTYDHCIERESL